MAVLLLTYLADIILLRSTNCNSEFEAEDENHKVPSSRLPSSSCWLGSGSTCCYNGTGHGTWKTAGDMDGGWKREKGKVLIVGILWAPLESCFHFIGETSFLFFFLRAGRSRLLLRHPWPHKVRVM